MNQPAAPALFRWLSGRHLPKTAAASERLGSVQALLAVFGLQNLVAAHGFTPDAPPLIRAVEPLGLFLVLRAVSSGCSAMTGIEAIANGVSVFREPAARRARATMLVMGLMLASMFLAVSGLAYLYGVAPDPDRTALAQDRFLPCQMGWIGDRLMFQNGIAVLLAATALIILVCRGDTTVAVNLYTLGVFIAFTLSQAGMVVLPARRDPVGNRSIVWIASLSRPSLEALRYAATVSDQVLAVWVRSAEDDTQRIRQDWQRLVGDGPGISLQILESPFASLIDPFVAFVAAQEQAHPEVSHTIVMPMAIPRYRFDSLLLNHRGINMHRALDASGNRVFTLVRYYLPA